MSAPRSNDEIERPARLDNLTLARKEGWRKLVNTAARIPPQPLARHELEALDEGVCEDYNRHRREWHANLGTIKTPQLKALHEDLWDIVDSNAQDGDKAKGAVAIDAFPGLGKTTAVLAFAREYHRREVKALGETTESGDERWPVCRVGLTGNTGMKEFNRAMLEFFAHPGATRGTAADYARRALDCVLSCEVRVLIIDDLHFLQWHNSSGVAISNHFKYIANEFPVTMIFIGVGLAARGLFSEGQDYQDAVLAQTGRRTTLLDLEPFTVGNEKGRGQWRQLLLNIENKLVLADKRPGMLADDLCETAEAMGRGGGGHSLSHILQRLETHPSWTSVREAFIELAGYLHTHESPIDYTRRRALDYSRLLPDDEWIQICRGADIRSGDGKKAAVARCYLYATISANPTRRAPGFIDTNDFVSALANFPAQMTLRLAEALDHCAENFLRHHDIDEPVTWCPPIDLIAGLDLPGVDPETVDIGQLHRLMHHSLTLGAIAKELDTSLESVRYTLSRHPVPEQLRNPATWPSPAIDALAQTLSAKQFAQLYHDENLSAKQIAVRYGVSKQTVVRLAGQYGIDLRPAHAHRRHAVVERDWLYTEYVINRRTLPELAAETGMSTMNMARWAKFHGIERRGRGGPSHTANINAAKAAQLAPEILRPALEQIGGDQRLSRFAATSTYPTVTAAAAALSLHQPVLHGQIKRLERELGGALLECAQRGHPMTLTALGVRVLEAWTYWTARP
ncbi:ATP-binding protein [Mycobacteroides abscessus]|uniref:ATP-binding protein n=1 Tax=Mycobacteroides abscessus TaxID=36809 RepID=UPI0002FCEAA6|nr:TniB family NTP-binding protein [Mycobacteroides abscessus]AMU33210.1 hypothetical protein A3N97_23400 [Mycobacteroides abscessus]ANO01375.1 hypothetical protein BAB74_23575 [Mycobacteroides abscessus]MBN7323885.1 AAA family ATPase [Mycobacteroides abscessus subsp. massiliense]MDO3031640.1 AAA family ATPase [Mycobacteroides abscessus subsp. massiliense]PVA87619.1 hypothetical protein DDJ47_14910 [Mycobacteroides abscessus]